MIVLGKKLKDTRGAISFEVLQTDTMFEQPFQHVIGIHTYNRTTATHTLVADEDISDNDVAFAFKSARELVSPQRFYRVI